MLGLAISFYIKICHILFLAWNYNLAIKNIGIIF